MTFSQGKIIEKKQIFMKLGRYFGKYILEVDNNNDNIQQL